MENTERPTGIVMVKGYNEDLKMNILRIKRWTDPCIPPPETFSDVQGIVLEEGFRARPWHMAAIGRHAKHIRLLHGSIPWTPEISWIGGTVEVLSADINEFSPDDAPNIRWERLKIFMVKLGNTENELPGIVQAIRRMPKLVNLGIAAPGPYARHHPAILRLVREVRPWHYTFFICPDCRITDMDDIVRYMEDLDNHTDKVFVISMHPTFSPHDIARALDQRGVSPPTIV